MKDIKKRIKGKYEEIFTKEKDGIEYKMIEVTSVGRNSEIISYSREYKPGLKYPMTWEQV